MGRHRVRRDEKNSSLSTYQLPPGHRWRESSEKMESRLKLRMYIFQRSLAMYSAAPNGSHLTEIAVVCWVGVLMRNMRVEFDFIIIFINIFFFCSYSPQRALPVHGKLSSRDPRWAYSDRTLCVHDTISPNRACLPPGRMYRWASPCPGASLLAEFVPGHPSVLESLHCIVVILVKLCATERKMSAGNREKRTTMSYRAKKSQNIVEIFSCG